MKKKPITEGNTRGSVKGSIKRKTPLKAIRPKSPPPAPKKKK
jgi:hypothetical protein